MRIPVRRLESLQPVALNPSHFFGFWFSSFGYDLGFSCFVTIVLVRTGLVRLLGFRCFVTIVLRYYTDACLVQVGLLGIVWVQ